MQKLMQTCKTQKQRRRILRRLWENQRRDKIVDQRNRRMETKGNGQIKSMIDKWEIDMLVSVKVKEKEEDPNWFREDNTFMSGNVMRMAREAKERKRNENKED